METISTAFSIAFHPGNLFILFQTKEQRVWRQVQLTL